MKKSFLNMSSDRGRAETHCDFHGAWKGSTTLAASHGSSSRVLESAILTTRGGTVIELEDLANHEYLPACTFRGQAMRRLHIPAINCSRSVDSGMGRPYQVLWRPERTVRALEPLLEFESPESQLLSCLSSRIINRGTPLFACSPCGRGR